VKLVLFDIDGTLITSRGAGARAMRSAFERGLRDRGRYRTPTISRAHRHPHRARRHGAEGWEPARVHERLDDFFEAYVGGLAAEIATGRGWSTLPGVAAVVERLARSSEAVLGLVTGNIEEGARIKLLPTGLWPRFRWSLRLDHMDRRHLRRCARRGTRCSAGVPARRPGSDRRHPARRGLRASLWGRSRCPSPGQYPGGCLLADAPITSSRPERHRRVLPPILGG